MKDLKACTRTQLLNNLYTWCLHNTWCLHQVTDKHMGKLDQEKIEKLDAIKFPWDYYKHELNKLGFNWAKNKDDSNQL